MFLAYLKDDTEHRWHETARVVDDLIWCLHPHEEDEERDQWVRVVPGLLKSLRAGLEEVSYNATRLDQMMDQRRHRSPSGCTVGCRRRSPDRAPDGR